MGLDTGNIQNPSPATLFHPFPHSLRTEIGSGQIDIQKMIEPDSVTHLRRTPVRILPGVVDQDVNPRSTDFFPYVLLICDVADQFLRGKSFFLKLAADLCRFSRGVDAVDQNPASLFRKRFRDHTSESLSRSGDQCPFSFQIICHDC